MESDLMSNNRIKIGILSGSFNPIHIAHQKLGDYLVENQIVDEVWFVLSPCNPLKSKSDLLDEYIRLDMLIMALRGNEHFKVSDVEFTMPVPSYSIDTLRLLSTQFPENQFYLIIGSDNALVFDQWKDYSQLLDEFPVLVYPRLNYNFEDIHNKYPQMVLLPTPYFDISSTQIRDLIAQKKDVSQLLHPSVYQFIIENNLYQ